jgi:DNA-binding NarL/FixJ family response regulator
LWFPEDAAPESAILRQAAANVDARIPVAVEPWAHLTRGALRIAGSYARGDCLHVTAYSADPTTSEPLTQSEAGVLFRVLCGEQQKAVAADLSIAASTASHHYVAALRKIGVQRGPVPLPVVVAAQRASGHPLGPSVQVTRFEHGGRSGVVLSVRRPDVRSLRALTPAEQEVAGLFIEGCSRPGIAQCRGTSALTVAAQVHAIFAALRLTGRYALIRRAGELGCF